MRYLFLLLALMTFPAIALAQSRVVDDTFKDGRESHLQSSEDMREEFRQQGAVMMDERNSKAEDEDRNRIVHRELSTQMAEQWNNDWDNDSVTRDDKKAQVEADRVAHRDALTPRPAQWWGLDTPVDTSVKGDTENDIDSDFNQ